MHSRLTLTVAVSLLLAAAFALRPGARAQQDRPRPAVTMTIDEYEPRSTLVVPQHPVPRAKYPVIDVHSHHPTTLAPERWKTIVSEMDGNNLRLLVNLSGGSGAKLESGIASIKASAAPDRMVFFANIDFPRGGITPGFGQAAAAQLERDVKAGAKGLKLFKNYGMDVRYADGRRVPVDDPEMDPVWAACARLNIPVLIHVGEPSEFFKPVDKNNERWLELTLLPNRRVDPAEVGTFDELMAERDRMVAKHPKTRFIIAHFGWHTADLGRLGALMDKMPNFFVETGAILYDLGRQPKFARAFFEKYQDRVLFGKDTYEASEYPYYWRTFETGDEYFDYYRKYHAFWKLYGLELPDRILQKVYYENALKVIPGLPYPSPGSAQR
jgi:predicted TIM-barrel fold metal-dependent hydrolase